MKNKISIGLVLFTSFIFLILGLVYPVLSSKTEILGFVIERKAIRLSDSIYFFIEEGNYILAVIVFVFTIIFPTVKFFDLGMKLFSKSIFPFKLNQILLHIDKWSMLDVFLVALLLINFKFDSNIIVMKLGLGTTFIACSIFTRLLTSYLIFKNTCYETNSIPFNPTS